MRLNKVIASATGISRRAADRAIMEGRVAINQQPATLGQLVSEHDEVTVDGTAIDLRTTLHRLPTTILLHKPVGYVVSRNGQGSRTVYDLLPQELYSLKPIGRLDKYSSGLLLLSSDGQLAYELTHPSRQKTKVYEVTIDKPLMPLHQQMITDYGIQLEDGMSRFQLERMREGNSLRWRIVMWEGRNRQIRRTFQALGYQVKALHRTQFGNYQLGNLTVGKYILSDS